jgi:quinol monooxygenase YgiN
MLAIIARVELAAGDADAYIDAAKPLVVPTLQEPGCQWYAMARDICDPNVVWISEQWESQETLDTHLRTQHIKDFLEVVSALTVVSMEPRQYEVTSVGPVVMPED